MAKYRIEEGSLQYRFLQSKKKVQVFGGGFANGKTAAICVKNLKIARDYPGSNLLLARASYKKLNDTLRKEFFKWCPSAWIKRMPTKDDNTCYLNNGSIINFRYVAQRGKSSDDGQTTSNLLSATFDAIAVDQIEDPEITHKDFLDLMGRLRGTAIYKPENEEYDPTMPLSGPRWLMVTCNPSNNWFYKEVIFPFHQWLHHGQLSDKLLVDEDTREPIIEVFEGSTYTNKANLPDDFIKGLESSYKGQMRKRFLMGKWAAYEGLVYPSFNDSRHVINRQDMLTYMRDLIRGKRTNKRFVDLTMIEMYDFGISSPSCYLLGFIDQHGSVHILDGFYRPDMNIAKQAEAIKDIRNRYASEGLEPTEDINADPDIFRRKVLKGGETPTTIADIFSDHGISMRPCANDIQAGIAKVSMYLNGNGAFTNPYRDFNPAVDIDEETGEELAAPMLYIALECDFIANEFNNYFWKRNPLGEFIDEPLDRNDHALDAIKYGLSTLPDPSEFITPVNALPPGWMYWHEEA